MPPRLAETGEDMTLTAEPQIAVLMAAYNAMPYLTEAVESILNQTYRNLKLYIVDDASSDGTADYLAALTDPRVVVLHNETNTGLAVALNRGLAAIDCELIARMDADDIALPDRLERQVRFMQSNPEVAVLGMAMREFGQGKETTKRFVMDPALIDWWLMFDPPLAHPTVMYRRSVVLQCGGYRGDFNLAEDYDLWQRIALNHRIANLRRVGLRYRLHAGQVTQSKRQRQLEIAYLVARRQIARLGFTVDDGILRGMNMYGSVADLARAGEWMRKVTQDYMTSRNLNALQQRRLNRLIAYRLWWMSREMNLRSPGSGNALGRVAMRQSPVWGAGKLASRIVRRGLQSVGILPKRSIPQRS